MSETPRAPTASRSSATPPADDHQSRPRWLLDDDDEDGDMDYMPAESGEEESLMEDEYDEGDFHGIPPARPACRHLLLTANQPQTPRRA